jgi:transcriptional/translational regulatory protein YebC/TACO1
VAEVRHKLSRGGGNMGATNSVSWMFDRKGQIYLDAGKYDEDRTLEAALEAGATDFVREEDQFVVTTDVASLHAVKESLESKGIIPTESEVAWIPKQTVSVAGSEAEAVLRLIESLDELDDVQKVDANFDIDASVMSGMQQS